jgi:hypothetical protein
MKKKKRVLPPLKSNPIVKRQEPIDKIIITGYVVVDNVAIYTVQIGSNAEPKKLSYSELCLAEALHKVPTVYEIEEKKP